MLEIRGLVKIHPGRAAGADVLLEGMAHYLQLHRGAHALLPRRH